MLLFWRLFAYVGGGVFLLGMAWAVGVGWNEPKSPLTLGLVALWTMCLWGPGLAMVLFAIFAHWAVKSARAARQAAMPSGRRFSSE